LTLAPSCGGGGANQTDKFVGPWTFASGTLVPMCPIAGVPNFNLMGLPVTFQKVDASTISLMLNAGCIVSFKVSGNKATVEAKQTCSLDTGSALGTVSVAITTWSLTLTGDHIDSSLSGTASFCTAMGTAVLVRGTPDAGVPTGGHGGSSMTGGAGATGSAGMTGGAGATGSAGAGGSGGADGSAGAGGAAGTDGGAPEASAGETGATDANDATPTKEYSEAGADAPGGDGD
jgi:hypothetical protein